jgi:DMSO/TMAO reductase YedYZ molybdopterin-dependent catalytic subunit
MRLLSRRAFLRQSLNASATTLAGLHGRKLWITDALARTVPAAFQPIAGGTLLGTAPFVGEGNVPLDTLFGRGLAARLVTDLSTLSPETLITPNYQFFVRTSFPDRLRSTSPWKILVRGLVERRVELDLNELMRDEVSMGTHLMECAGNTRLGGFGLISMAKWSGIPMAKVLERVNIKKSQATRVIISGFDEHSTRDAISLPGASWIFTFEQLEAAGAFLATGMNALPLPKDHGYPVRFIMPGWYACTCVKWVNQILLVDDTAPATGHMKEYASRTFQQGVPKLAKDFTPATIDLAAMPVRVEGWRVDGKLVYRIVGILWGGSKPTRSLTIRFNPDTDYVPVRDYDQQTNATWTVWSHTWLPAKPGRYEIQLQVNDPAVRTRHLDNGYYVRTVQIPVV